MATIINPATTTQSPSAILDQFRRNAMLVVEPRFRSDESRYRYDLETDPETSADIVCAVELGPIRTGRSWEGAGIAYRRAAVIVRMRYRKQPAEDGARLVAIRDAGDDAQRIVDSCLSVENYGSETTGIRVVTHDGSRPTMEDTTRLIWEHLFDVEWQAPYGHLGP